MGLACSGQILNETVTAITVSNVRGDEVHKVRMWYSTLECHLSVHVREAILDQHSVKVWWMEGRHVPGRYSEIRYVPTLIRFVEPTLE